MNKIKINLVLKGKPAQWPLGLRKRRLVTSCRDAVVQFFKVFQEKVVVHDLKEAHLKTLSGGECS